MIMTDLNKISHKVFKEDPNGSKYRLTYRIGGHEYSIGFSDIPDEAHEAHEAHEALITAILSQVQRVHDRALKQQQDTIRKGMFDLLGVDNYED